MSITKQIKQQVWSNLSTEMTRTRKVKMKLVVTMSQVSLWSSALWICRFDGLEDW